MGCCGDDVPSPFPTRRIGDIREMHERYLYSPESKKQRKIIFVCLSIAKNVWFKKITDKGAYV